MKSEFLKIAGVKSEKAFYKKYPTEAAFFKAHPEAKKLMPKAQVGYNLPTTGGTYGMNALNSYLMSTNIPNTTPGIVDGMGADQQGIDPSGYTSYTQGELTPLNTKTMGVILPQNNMSFPTIQNTPPVPGAGSGGDDSKTPDLGKLVGATVGGIQAIKKQKQELAKAKQMSGVTALFRQASGIREQAPERRYTRPEDVIINPNQVFPTYGVGTNVLAKNGTEIQNTFAPNTLYDDLGYEPLNDDERIKQYQFGGIMSALGNGAKSLYSQGKNMFGQAKGMFSKDSLSDFATSGGLDKVSGMIYPDMNESGTAQIGGGIGEAAGTALGGPIGGAIGKFAGQTIGRAVDPYQKKIKREKANTQSNVSATMINNGAMGLQNQYASYMEDGGLIPIMEEGGELQTHWGGYAEQLSQNPYMPQDGETVMFRGQSHDDSDGYGNTGIGITYGDNPVEVERGEPAAKIGDDLVVYGNLQIPNQYVELFGKEAKGKKFKNYVADLSKQENKNNKLIDKSTVELDELDVTNPFDKLKLNALQANITGANAKLKEIADKKMKAAHLQNAINETAEEFGVDADHLAKGKIKIADQELTPIGKNGYNAKYAKGGDVPKVHEKLNTLADLLEEKGYDFKVTSGLRKDAKTAQGRKSRHSVGEAIDVVFPKLGTSAYKELLADPDVARFLYDNGLTIVDEYDKGTLNKTKGSGSHLHIGFDKGTPEAEAFRNDYKKTYSSQPVTADDTIRYLVNPDEDIVTTSDETTGTPVGVQAMNAMTQAQANTQQPATTTDETSEPTTTVTQGTEKVIKDKPKNYSIKPRNPGKLGYDPRNKTAVDEWKGENYNKVWKPEVEKMLADPVTRDKAISLLENYEGPYAKEVKSRIKGAKTTEEKAKIIYNLATDEQLGPFHDAIRNIKNVVTAAPEVVEAPKQPAEGEIPEVVLTAKKKKEVPAKKDSGLTTLVNQLIPYFRPSDAEPLDPNQLLGEMYALSSNQLEPVQAQSYQPDLITPYDISYQDALNANQSDYNAQLRMVGDDPAAQAALNAQKYAANQKVLGEQFRANQAEKMGVYNQNINTLNDAKLKNIGIYDQQYDRQAQAKANTKATTQAALNSISSKYLQNDAANRKLQIYENLYNYRFDPMGRAINMNGLVQFYPTGSGAGANGYGNILPVYDANGNQTGWKAKADSGNTKTPKNATPPFVEENNSTGKNGKKIKNKNLNSTIVKAIKNL